MEKAANRYGVLEKIPQDAGARKIRQADGEVSKTWSTTMGWEEREYSCWSVENYSNAVTN